MPVRQFCQVGEPGREIEPQLLTGFDLGEQCLGLWSDRGVREGLDQIFQPGFGLKVFVGSEIELYNKIFMIDQKLVGRLNPRLGLIGIR